MWKSELYIRIRVFWILHVLNTGGSFLVQHELLFIDKEFALGRNCELKEVIIFCRQESFYLKNNRVMNLPSL